MARDEAIGGGGKKVLYTLQTVQRIGVAKAAKALTAKNTCKACGLGMGGQLGGMTNELGEFPSVCNKSVQAQSTDIQPAIPHEIFEHSLDELRELSGREMETLGRLSSPIYKAAGTDRYNVIDWDEAYAIAVATFGKTDPARSFFYSSGRSSNEAGFLLQLFARAWGTNNVNNCSYYCHQATSVALEQTIGSGTATVELADLGKSDLIFVIGANPSSNHPRFIHQLKACRDRGGDVIVINPAKEPGLVKFAILKSPSSMLSGGSEIASLYLQPRIGGDIAVFKGIARSLIENGACNAGFIDQFSSGFSAFSEDIMSTPWSEIEKSSGLTRQLIEKAAGTYARASNAVFAWGMGMTHHLHGVQNIEYISNLALLRGMIGRPGAGLLPLRGHSNVQGIGTIGVKPVLPKDVIEKMETAFSVSFPRARGLDTMASMQAAFAGDIDLCLLMGGNLFSANPNSAWAAAALDKIPFKICLTTTLNRGHVNGVDSGACLVLPVAARDEEWQPTTQESMFNFVRLSDGGIIRHAGVRPEVVILADLASRVLEHSPIDFGAFKQHATIREAIAKIVPGMEALADIDVARREFTISNRILHEPTFRTPDRKAHFIVRPLESRGRSAPYMLTTMRSEGQFNSIIYEEHDSYRRTETRWSVLMNADDIKDAGMKPGDYADIRSDGGVMKNVTVYAFGLPRGDVMAYYPEANVLTATDVDPRSQTPGFKSTPVWIERAHSEQTASVRDTNAERNNRDGA